MNYQQVSDVNIDGFAALSDRIVSAIAGANDAVREADAAIKSAQAQISLSRSALQVEASDIDGYLRHHWLVAQRGRTFSGS